MTDIARIGFAAATSALKEAKGALEALVPASKRAEAATDAVNASIDRQDTKARKAASGVSHFGKAVGSFVGAIQNGMKWVLSFVQGLNTVPGAATKASTALDRLGKHASDNINRMQATPGNIAAQFQDIGVAAAGGMSPMLIALQQGTQLAPAMMGGLRDLGQALKQLFGPTQILTIAMVGLIAAGIQMIDWPSAAASALNMLADVLVQIAPYATLAAAGLALIYAPQIIAGVVTLTKAMYGLASGILATIGLPALLVLGLTAAVAAAVHFRDELTEYFGFDIVQAAQDGVNMILNAFVGAYKAVMATWRLLPAAIGDVVIQAANAAIRGTGALVNGVLDTLNPLNPLLRAAGIDIGKAISGIQIDNPFAGAAANVGEIASAAYAAEQGVDRVGKIVTGIKDGAKTAADYMRKWAKELLSGEEVAGGKKGGAGANAGGVGKTEADRWAELLSGADKTQRGLEQAGAQIGLYGEDLARLQYEYQLFNQAQDDGIKLTAAMTQELKDRAAVEAARSTANAHDQFIEGMNQEHDMLMAQLDRERGALGLSGEALTAYTYVTERLLAAKQKHIDLSPARIAAIEADGAAYAQHRTEIDATTEAIKRQQDALKQQKDMIKGVFTEWVQGVQQGQSVWSAFTDTILNGLNKIINKLLDSALDAALDSLLSLDSNGSSVFATLFSANGNAFNAGGGIAAFAKGGTFTNSIVDSPTLFKFAKGTGVMGEAGPEAIMPLKRGADGSLGVQMHGGASAAPANNNVAVNQNFTVSGAVSSTEITAAIRQAADKARNDALRAVPEAIAEYQRNGTTG